MEKLEVDILSAKSIFELKNSMNCYLNAHSEHNPKPQGTPFQSDGVWYWASVREERSSNPQILNPM